MHKIFLFILFLCFLDCSYAQNEVSFNSNNDALNQSFDWAKNKALSFAHDGSDPVGYWYEAALPNREAFCMRDASHQAIGAEILGLSKHNFNMFLKFSQNISKEKDYCSYWEINRYNKPAPVDYQNDKDFWYNLPANFDIIYNAYRLYSWTGNTAYLNDPSLKKFYKLSLNEYVDHWDLGYDKVTGRNRSMYVSEMEGNTKSRFGNKRGIPTYNEGGRGETLLGIDMTASLIAAYKAYSKILTLSGDPVAAKQYIQKAGREQKFLDEFWWDRKKEAYRSIWYADKTFDYFMSGNDEAFLHYLLYFDVISDQKKIESLMNNYISNFDHLIVELKSYLPIIFYENGQTKVANKMIVDLCSPENKRRNYPENSFTVIEHITRGLMGISVDAASNTVSTISRLVEKEDWAEMKNIPLLSNQVSVKHFGAYKTIFTNQSGPTIKWNAQLAGKHKFLYTNGHKKRCFQAVTHGQHYSYCILELNPGDEVVLSIGN